MEVYFISNYYKLRTTIISRVSLILFWSILLQSLLEFLDLNLQNESMFLARLDLLFLGNLILRCLRFVDNNWDLFNDPLDWHLILVSLAFILTRSSLASGPSLSLHILRLLERFVAFNLLLKLPLFFI